MNLKNIHIGQLIQAKVAEQNIKTERLLNYFDCNETTLKQMYEAESIDTKLLLGWCKLLKFDFFRLFVGHLQLHAAIAVTNGERKVTKPIGVFRKNVYSKEIRTFLLDNIKNGNMDAATIIAKYSIPRTTIYSWIRKYS